MFLNFLFGKKRSKKEEKLIHPSEIKEGMLVKIPLPWFRHPFLTSRIRIKTKNQIDKIMSLDIPYVIWIPDNREEGEKGESAELSNETQELYPDTNSQETFTAEKKASVKPPGQFSGVTAKIHHVKVQRCQKIYDRTIVEVRQLIKGVLAFSEDAVEESNKMMEKMVNTLLEDPSAMMFLVNAKKKTEEIFHHALNTCILGLLLGRAEKLSPEELHILGMGILFHDIGKIRIPKSILYKEAPLTKSERIFLQQHPQYGVELVSRIENFPGEATKIIFQHHELLDGSGYPRHLKGSQINTLTRITTIVNIYDNYCNRRKVEESLTPHQALARMYKRLYGKLDRKLLEKFIRILGVYPPGTIVRLNNGSYGIVVGKASDSPYDPLVLLYDSSVPSSKAPIISLSEEKDLKIVKSLKPSDLPEKIFFYLNPPLRIAYMVDSLDKM